MRLSTVLPGLNWSQWSRKSHVLGLPLLLIGAICSACSSNSVSQTKHDLKAPVRDAGSWNWNSATDDDYANIMAPLLGLDASSILPGSHPIVQRAQFWLDQVDASLRSKYPAALAAVPKPQAKVLKVGVPNAFVAPVPTCYNVPVQVGKAGPAKGRKIYIDVKTGALAVWPAEFKCKNGDASRSGLAIVNAFVNKFNASANACKFVVSASGAIQPNSSCEVDPDVYVVGESSGVVLMETASFITVHSGILTIMPEADFVSVLAHELGHYYRSHATAPKGEYDYFYTLAQDEPDHKPTPEADKADLGQSAVVASGMLSAADNFPVVSPTQRLRTDLFETVGSLVTQVAGQDGAPDACTAAAAFLTSPSFKSTMGQFPFVKAPSAKVVDTYLASERQLLACLAALKFSSDGSLDATTVGFDAIRALAAHPTWPDFLTSMTPSRQARLSQVNGIVAARLGSQAPEATTALEAMLALSQGFVAQDDQSRTILKLVHDQHLGEYTSEQEADDESAEWIADLGIDPAASVDSMRALGKGMKTGLAGNILSQDDCERLWKAGWLDADGNYSFIPVGNFTDPHHSVCYRMFNIDREVKAHKLVARGVAPTATGPAWSDLQAMATALVPAPALDFTGATQSVVSPFVAKTGAMSCSYSYMYQPK